MSDGLEPGQIVGGLRIERELGRGAFAVVYLAFDGQLERHVALKVVSAAALGQGGHERERLRAEARLVAGLTSPHIVTLYRVHDLGARGFALEMEHVAGGTLARRLERGARVPPSEAVHVLRGVLAALQAAHERHVIHRDVKPENVLLTPDGEVKLADFGLGKHVGESSLSGDGAGRIRGTPLYVAPEVVMGEAATPASDLWSVGVLAYRMLTGQAPFQAANLASLFYAIHAAEPAPLPPDVPHLLRTLVEQCLQKAPDRRPADAAAALKLLEGPQGGEAAAAGVGGESPARTVLQRPRLVVGRLAEQQRLAQLLGDLERGQGAGLWITGEAGIGKTALLQELRRRAEASGARVLEVTLPPLGGFQRPLLETLRRCLAQEGDAEELAGGRFASAAAAVRALSAQDAAVLQGRQPALWAAQGVLAALARERALVLTVEDAHEGDAEDLRLLGELMRGAREDGLLVAATFRTHDPATSGGGTTGLSTLTALRQQPGTVSLDLDPLAPDEIAGLIQAGDDPGGTAVVQRLLELSEGNPLFALELVRHMLANGALVRGPSGLSAGPHWDRLALPARLSELVRRRLEALDEPGRALLDAACVDGLTLDGEALAAVTEGTLLGVLRALQRLYRTHDLVTPQPDGFHFTHAVVREVLYASLSDDLRVAYHRAFARHLQARPAPGGLEAERLGRHFERAGQRAEARPHLLEAALGAAQRQEYVRSSDLARRAGLDPLHLTPQEARAGADLLLVLVHSYAEARHAQERDRILDALAEGARQAGDTLLADRTAVERSFLDFYARGAQGVDVAALQGAVRRLPLSKALGRAHYTLGMRARVTGELEEARTHLTQAERIYGQLGLAGHRASALDQLGSVAWRSGRLQQALSLYEESIRLSRETGRMISAAVTLVNRAGVCETLGRPEGVEQGYNDALLTLARWGDQARAEHVRTLLAAYRLGRGDLQGAHALSVKALSALRGLEALDPLATCLGTHVEVLAGLGRLVEARGLLEEARVAGQRTGNREHAVVADAQDALLKAVAGRVPEAEALLGRLAGDAQLYPRARTRVAELALTSVLLLGSRPLLNVAQRLLPTPAAEPSAEERLLLALREGAAALFGGHGGAVDGQALARAGAEVAKAAEGRGLLVSDLCAAWFQGAAHALAGHRLEAAARIDSALTRARSAGHVWWQARLLCERERLLGDLAAATQRRALLAPVSAALSEVERAAFQDAWEAR